MFTSGRLNEKYGYTLTDGEQAGDKVYRFWFIDCDRVDPDLQTASQTFYCERYTITGYYGWVGDGGAQLTNTAKNKSTFQRHWREVHEELFSNLGLYGDYNGERVFNDLDPSPSATADRIKWGNLYCWRVKFVFTGTIDDTF